MGMRAKQISEDCHMKKSFKRSVYEDKSGLLTGLLPKYCKSSEKGTELNGSCIYDLGMPQMANYALIAAATVLFLLFLTLVENLGIVASQYHREQIIRLGSAIFFSLYSNWKPVCKYK